MLTAERKLTKRMSASAINFVTKHRIRQNETEDLFGYCGILEGKIDIPKGKSEMRRAYYEM